MAAAFLRPALRILNPLRMPFKIAIIASMFLLAAVTPTILMVRAQNAYIAQALSEEKGVLVFKPLFALAKDVTLHRLTLQEKTGGEDVESVAMGALEASILKDLEALVHLDPEVLATLRIREAADQLRQHGEAMLADKDPRGRILAHDKLLDEISALESTVVDSSLLIADPEVVSFYLVDLATQKLPAQASQVLRLSLLLQEPGAERAAWTTQLQRQSGSVQSVMATIRDEMGSGKAFANPAVAQRLRGLLRALGVETGAFIERLEAEIQGGAEAAPAMAYAGKKTVQSCFRLQETALRVLEDLLQGRIQERQRDQRWALGGAVAASLLAFYLLAALHSGLRSGFDAMGKSLSALAVGDLSQRIQVESRDELGTLVGHLNRTLDEVGRMVVQIKTSAQSLQVAAREIAQESEDLARRTESQAASLEETATSLDSVALFSARSGAQARSADEDVGRMAGLARGCREAVERAARAIGEIDEASRQVVEVTRVVEEIAFHANLTAVDAVTTAAAGDKEQGFTALASQVHDLGKRSAQASSHIQKLLEKTLASIQRGVLSATQAEGTVTQITADLQGVTASITEITGAAQEQAMSIDQIREAMTELGGLTLHNAALVEQSQAASRDLALHAKLLAELTERFKVE